MSDSVSVQLYDGARCFSVKVVDVSDGTGLSGYTILTAADLNPNPGAHAKIRRIRYAVIGSGYYVRIQWKGGTNADIAYLGQGEEWLNFSETYAGGYPNNAVTPTGDIVVTTTGSESSYGFTLEIEGIKGV